MSLSRKYNRVSNCRSARRARSFRVSGPLLRSLRAARGWIQREAAERAGLSERLLRKAEAGGPIELQSIAILAQLFSTRELPLTANELLAGRHDRSRAPSAVSMEVLVRRWFEELWNQGRLDVIKELAAPECVLHAQGDDLHGHAAVRQRMEAMRSAFGNVDFVVDTLAAHDNMVGLRWHVTVTHTGEWMGVWPSGRRFAIYGSSWIRINGGLLREAWDFWDQRQVSGTVNA